MPVAVGIVASSVQPPITVIPTSGLIGWWDASNASAVQSSGGLVSQLNDLSLNGRHFVSSGAFRPTLTNGGMKAGLNNLTFASGNRMENQTSGTANQKPFSAFIAMRHTNVASYRAMLGSPATGAMEWRLSNVHRQSSVKNQVAEIGLSTSAVPANATTILGLTYSATGAFIYYLDSVANGTGTNDQSFNGASAADYIGDAVGEPFVGSIAELIKDNLVISGSELTQSNSYLSRKGQ
jgi:hypothetical protein